MSPRGQERLELVRTLPLHQQLGMTEINSEEGRGDLRFEVQQNQLNPAGMLHGGVLYTLCDVCAYAGLLSVLDDQTEAVTHDLHVSVMGAMGAGASGRIRSRVVRMGRRVVFIDAEVMSDDRIIASARITKSLVAVTA
ncbi:PaaI family thioesterase [Algiphilus sp.]|jgi:uncharacterized protein (TIGR00369 family)|uniref:PaaI family thioesterase n=1 Tax=Algiphilus sp. TaxID=1872431 RepID=UPI001CA7B1BB|nr:PaaI family thioesterase [Algiphilus sp.]MBY8964893.1 PaaI family thioesterase [Algiphilus acroporae]MCI5062670.1 PaaI family thioesterase [Algiphilus sp.]MCI5103283.1 PaaI family thioesterase [Algiphilus sp.]